MRTSTDPASPKCSSLPPPGRPRPPRAAAPPPPGEAAAVMKARMAEAVADDGVAPSDESGQDPDVRGISRREDERGLAPGERGDDFLPLREPPGRSREERR